MNIDFTGIARSLEYSPNHETNDAAIIRLTRDEIEAQGYGVAMLEENDLPTARVASPVVFHMCQGPRSLPWLRRLERDGKLVINPAQAVANCYRSVMTPLFAAAGVPFPRTTLVGTDARALPPEVADAPSLWVKRGDVHAMQKGDVVRVRGRAEAVDALAALRARGIPTAVLQEHVEGDVVKFYAIHRNGFFECLHAEGPATRPVDQGALHAEAERAAEAAGLSIYGGDFVVGESGITLIDLNDWPSFAPFRERAAVLIAHQIIKEARAHGRIA